jgi:hypothetical protein
LKRWVREFEGRVQPLVKQMEKLHTLLSNDLVAAAAYLAQALNTLSAYAEIKPPSLSEAPGGSSASAPASPAPATPSSSEAVKLDK